MIPTVAVQMMMRMAALDGTHSNLQKCIGDCACVVIHTVLQLVLYLYCVDVAPDM